MSEQSGLNTGAPIGDTKSSTSGARIHEKINRAASAAHETVDAVGNAASSAKGRLCASGQQFAKDLKEYVDTRPIATLGAAFAIGIVISLLLPARKSSGL